MEMYILQTLFFSRCSTTDLRSIWSGVEDTHLTRVRPE